MPRPVSILGLVLLAVLLTGCASTSYRVQINSFTASERAALEASRTVAVIPSSSSGNALFAAEVRRKTETLLSEMGFEVVEPEQADVLVFTLFGMAQPRTESNTLPIYTPGGTSVSQSGNVTVIGQNPGSWSSLTQTVTRHDRWMTVAAADAAPFHTKDLTAEEIPWLWMSEVISSGRSGDLRKVIDYMLVPTMEWFGKSTGEIVSVRIAEDDDRVARLRAAIQ